MPQIAQIATTYGSQLFWLLLTFGLIYLVVGRGMVPKISGTVAARDQRIADDLAAAEAARADADAREEAYRAQVDANRADALKVTQAAKESAARATEVRVKAADAETGERVAACRGPHPLRRANGDGGHRDRGGSGCAGHGCSSVGHPGLAGRGSPGSKDGTGQWLIRKRFPPIRKARDRTGSSRTVHQGRGRGHARDW
jgi:F-type H+-transporting ATPase subunit b